MKFDNEIPIYIQLVEQIKQQIISGQIKPGERLPSVRDLSFYHKVNPNTMQKALNELEEDGLIITERTNGKFVTNSESLINKYKNQYAKELSKKYIASMNNVGLNIEEIIKLINEIGGDK